MSIAGSFPTDGVEIEGREIGISQRMSISANASVVKSRAVVDLGYANPGTEAVFLRGEPNSRRETVENHAISEIRVTIAPLPYCEESIKEGCAAKQGITGVKPAGKTGDWPVTESTINEWHSDVRAELEAGRISPCVGSKLVSETDRVRVWHLLLAPGERLGFHRHVLDYFWTATSSGRSRSHYADGRVHEKEIQAGETCHFTFGAGEEMVHDLQNIGTDTLSFVTVEFMNCANAPQPIDGMTP